MADEWWSAAARTDDDGASASCSTTPATDQDAAESAATSTTTSVDFRASLHVDAAAPPASFLADPLPHMDWTQAYMGGRAAAEASSSFNDALLQLHGDAGRHFLLPGQQHVIDGAAPVAAPQGASLYADSQYSSSYGDAPAAALMTKPFSQQEFSGFFGDMPAVPSAQTKPLLLQALEQKAFKSHKERIQVQDACSSATRARAPDSPAPAPAKKPRIATPSPLPTFKVCVHPEIMRSAFNYSDIF